MRENTDIKNSEYGKILIIKIPDTDTFHAVALIVVAPDFFHLADRVFLSYVLKFCCERNLLRVSSLIADYFIFSIRLQKMLA